MGAAEYRTALAAAPGEVTLEDDTLISDCLVPEQTGGDLATVGKQMIAAATLSTRRPGRTRRATPRSSSAT